MKYQICDIYFSAQHYGGILDYNALNLLYASTVSMLAPVQLVFSNSGHLSQYLRRSFLIENIQRQVTDMIYILPSIITC